MKNKKITRDITQGVYALITNGGGCIVDAVSQVSAGDNPCIAVAVMKSNNTHDLMVKNNLFTLSVISEEGMNKAIETFGLNSMRDIDKFARIECLQEKGINYLKDAIGFMLCEKIDEIDMGTHTLFIGRLIEADKFNDKKPMSYAYYQEHKEELIKVDTKEGKTAWVCTICGYVYYGEELPEDFKCPRCGVDASLFEKK